MKILTKKKLACAFALAMVPANAVAAGAVASTTATPTMVTGVATNSSNAVSGLGAALRTAADSEPFGAIDSAIPASYGIRMRGWALDPDTSNSISVHVYMDDKRVASFSANKSRTDLDRTYHLGNNHGFDFTLNANDGNHQVCIYAVNSPAGRNPLIDCKVVLVGPNASDRVLLTFDDCPNTPEEFKQAIDYAQKAKIGLLIFPTSQCVMEMRDKGLDLVGYARQRGMWVGNHSLNHTRLTDLTNAQVWEQLTAEPQTRFFRPPYGSIDDRVRGLIADAGMRVVMWSIDTNDWEGKNQQQIVDYVLQNTKPGATVLMHMQHAAFSPGGLAAIKSGLASRGMTVCPASSSPTTAHPPLDIC